MKERFRSAEPPLAMNLNVVGDSLDQPVFGNASYFNAATLKPGG